MKCTNEMLEKAKTAKSAAELLAMAKENNIDLTQEQAIEYYAKLHGESGELADEELEQAAGGRVNRLDWQCPYCSFSTPGMDVGDRLEAHIRMVHPGRWDEYRAAKNKC